MSSPYRSGEAEPLSPWELVPPVLYWDVLGGEYVAVVTSRLPGPPEVAERTERRRVPGGWLYRVEQYQRPGMREMVVNIVFVPSPAPETNQ